MRGSCASASTVCQANGAHLHVLGVRVRERDASNRSVELASSPGGKSRSRTLEPFSTCCVAARDAAPSSRFPIPNQITQTCESGLWRTHGGAQ